MRRMTSIQFFVTHLQKTPELGKQELQGRQMLLQEVDAITKGQGSYCKGGSQYHMVRVGLQEVLTTPAFLDLQNKGELMASLLLGSGVETERK